MELTPRQLTAFQRDGYLLLPACFSAAEVALMQSRCPVLFDEDSPRRVVEKEGGRVRSVYGSHVTDEVFAKLCRDPRLAQPARQLLQGDIYVYQFKINAKAAFDGDVWEWHQDFIFWNKEDGMPSPRVLNVVVYLDAVTEFNGPMYVIPGSHRGDMVDSEADDSVFEKESVYQTGPKWLSNLTATLKYTLDRETVACMASRFGMDAPKGPAGSVLLFHPNLYHCSPNNMSPSDRSICIVTYNSVDNKPVRNGKPERPEFLCSRDFSPVTPSPKAAIL